MDDNKAQEEIYSQIVRAGKRTYFFDVRATRADDYYLTITESKKFTNEDGTFYYKKHKIYLYKEDFDEFNNSLKETCDFIIDKKGAEVISEKHDKDFDSKKEKEKDESAESVSTDEEKDFADVDFENDDQQIKKPL